MSHWFDDFTKNLATAGPVPRRSFLQLIATAAGTRLVEGMASPFAGLVAGIPFAGRALAAPAACAWRRSGTLITNEVSLSRQGITFHRLYSFDLAKQVGTLSATMAKGSNLIFKTDVSAKKGGPVTATTNYGPDIHGAKTVTVRSRDGKSFEGEMDGRAFTARGSEIKFADGQPAPTIEADPNLMSALSGLVSEAAKSLVGCSPAAPQRTRGFISAPGQDWYSPFDEAHGSCLECTDDCAQTMADKTESFACWLTPGCVAEAVAECVVCQAACYLPGGGCLPNPCGSFTTCAENDQCFDFKDGKLCCPAPAALCQGVCCGKDRTTCAPDGTCGCTSSETQCGSQCCGGKTPVCSNGICCAPGQVNHEGKCCRTDLICGGICCDELSKCVDPKTGLCCSFTAVVCAGKCCQPGEQCINEKCCAKPCGKTCCGAGQVCKDGKCLSIQCPGDLVTCLTEEDPYQKGPVISVPKAICCPPKVACCAGKCCKPGEICCGKGVPFGCHDPSLCLA